MKIWRALNFLLLLSLAMGRSAQASPLTVNVSGTIDLSGFGASAASTFTGSVTWESTTPAGGSSISNLYTFGAAGGSVSFVLNGTNYSGNIDTAVSGTAFNVLNSSEDLFGVSFVFTTPLNLGAGPDLVQFLMNWRGPGSMFASAALPGNLAFLGQSTVSASGANGLGPTILGSLQGVAGTAAVPEPVSLSLVGAGLAAAAIRRRVGRSRKS
jgi:hypothetical protein